MRLVLWSAVAYAVLLVLLREVFPQGSSQTISLLGIPLLIVAIIIARDLAGRSTNPTALRKESPQPSLRLDPVGFLSGQIGVASAASNSYFDGVVRARLKELLIDKVSLETGLEKEAVRRSLSNRERARILLHNESLYEVLFGPIPDSGSEKMRMVNDAIELIGDWTG